MTTNKNPSSSPLMDIKKLEDMVEQLQQRRKTLRNNYKGVLATTIPRH